MTTTQSRNGESSANVALSDLLRGMLPSFQVRAEQTRAISGHPSLRPDILITAAGRSPVVVEAGREPALGAETDARIRLGLEITDEPRPIEAAIALRYPEAVGNAYDLDALLAGARLYYCVVYENGGRFPQSGWLNGDVADLADLIRLVSVPQKAVAEAADDLEQGIESAVNVLNRMLETRPDINPAIARRLNLTDVPQMRRMAGAIIANAMLFHERLAGQHGVKPLQQICNRDNPNPQADILDAWRAILDVNYLDIFEIARDIVAELPTREAAQILNIISFHVLNIAARGVNNDHDLTGQVFQRLIADRKYLATFYTLPASADLLARLAVAKLSDVDWSDADAIAQLRVADFACGTGALLSAVYEQIAARHERAGGNAAQLHPKLLEEVIYGCDVMPSAVHITGATLAGRQPNVGFRRSNLRTKPYGRQADGEVRIGSLDLLDPDDALAGEMPDAGFDLVIMNPPFTRAANHEGAHATVANPAFAAFDASRDEQTAMGRRINALGKGTCYHGNAGIASAFAALGDKMLRPGGVLALVLPLSAASGLSWESFRQMLADDYADAAVLSIAANGREMSFSSDTGTAECLIVARKRDNANNRPASRAQFTSLHYRPHGIAQSAAIAQSIVAASGVRGLEDGPYGGTQLLVGDDVAGVVLDAPSGDDGANWGSVRMLDYSLAQTAHAMTESKLWLPGQLADLDLPMTILGSIGSLGLVHRDITGPLPRGPFNKTSPSSTATYPALWNHDATRETRIVCQPDSQLEARPGMETRAAAVWTTATRNHLNLDFTFGSQPLAVAFTEREAIGGRVWPNVSFPDARFDYAFALWANSTLGLLSYWWRSSRQQSSKAGMTIRSAESLPVMDFRALTDEQLATAQAIFEEFRDKELQPAYLSDVDENRALLDRRVVCDLLGFDESTYRAVRLLTAKWCAEPSVHGNKQRPQGTWRVNLVNDRGLVSDASGLAPELVDSLYTLNPWWRDEPMLPQPNMRRHLVMRVRQRLESEIAPIVVVRGPRQVGKTTAQLQIISDLLSDGVPPTSILRVQFDELGSMQGIVDPILRISNWFEQNITESRFNSLAQQGQKAYLFFDEVQNLDNWSAQLKFLVDHYAVKVMVTGSSALRIERGRDSLAGRITTVEAGVLSLTEIGLLRDLGSLQPFLPDTGLSRLIDRVFWQELTAHGQANWEFRDEAFRYFSERGGYPMVHNSMEYDWPLLADQLNETVIQRVIQHDLSAGEGESQDAQLLEELFRLSCRYVGQTPSATLLADQVKRSLNVDIGAQRVGNHLRLLADTLLLRLIPPLEMRVQRSRGSPKLCLADHGLRASWLQEQIPLDPTVLSGQPELTTVAGHLAESVFGSVCTTIPGLGVAHFPPRGTTDPEVDFVLTVGDRRLPVEIKYQRRIDPVRDTHGILRFIERSINRAPFGLLITQDDSAQLDDPRIVTMPLSTFMLLR